MAQQFYFYETREGIALIMLKAEAEASFGYATA
jgi:hypothetical protein